MSMPSPESRWGDLLNYEEDEYGYKHETSLKPEATDKQKTEFEGYMMFMSYSMLKECYPELEDPYYTWEGKIVERSSLEGRKLPLVARPSEDDDILL